MSAVRVCAAVAVLAFVACAPAQASDHLMRINEVALSAAGNGAAQYVELRDPMMEPFLAMPYRVVVYSAGGMRLGGQTVGPSFGTSPYLVSTAPADQVFGTMADTRLNVALPTPSGQICFTRGLGEARIHCLAYGNVAVPLSSQGGTQSGPTPPNCRSLERTAGGSYSVAAPTPNVANDGQSPAGACAVGPDRIAPRQRLSLRRRRDVDSVVLRVRLDEGAELTVSAFARIAGSDRRLRFRTVRKQVRAGVSTRVVLRLRRSRRLVVKDAIADGKVVRARVTVEANDSSRNESVTRRRIRLTD